ncbi:PP2C family protein-serine/threonine phosphatase [Streptomyces bohaiensis]|uniref:SpoIIE family protein phosphatase n=1 Tax=Streptomyces bohaiensis TaxID=1431344 RepID=A0ABX1CGP9_9ACTN|nr:SpoIIE family protein phosphatase [Streptomyces bohaiensis]NJQ15604.1 SpoIIE family protein phosphatase [Streptomyces bohaiensis]
MSAQGEEHDAVKEVGASAPPDAGGHPRTARDSSGPGPLDRHDHGGGTTTDAVFTALLEDSAEELYEKAPCGYLSTLMDGTVARVNGTLLDWLGLSREQVVSRLTFPDLLTGAGKLFYETRFFPLLRLKGEVNGMAMDLSLRDGRLPVMVSATLKTSADGQPLLMRITLFDARDRRAYEAELLRGKTAADEARARAEADRARLQSALAVLQRSLLPDDLPRVPGVEVASYYHTASLDQLGGDFYDLFQVDGSRWAFFLGDVCGKGPEAAAVTSLVRYTLRAAALHDSAPEAALATLNTVLYERYTGSDPRYCTAIFGVLRLRPGTDGVEISLASGGHPPALVVRRDGEVEQLRTPGGLLVGVLPTANFTTAGTVLGAGDTLLLHTDGLTEARTGADRGLYGDAALAAFARERAPVGATALVEALTELLHGFGAGLDDDTALLALGVPVTGAGTAAGTAEQAATGTDSRTTSHETTV